MMEPLRLGKKTEKTGIGMRKDPSKEQKPIKPISKKQKERTKNVIHPNFERVLKVQRELYGSNFCQAGAGEWKDKCPNNKRDGKKFPLVPDHVFTRNGKDVDRHENLQPLCTWCNFQKSSKRIDFRLPEFVEACRDLDRCNACGSAEPSGCVDEREKPE